MTTLNTFLTIAAAYIAFFMFCALPGQYLTKRLQRRTFRFILTYTFAGHTYYWDNADECWSLFQYEATMFATRNTARQAMGMAEACLPEEDQFAEVTIKPLTFLHQ